MIGRSCYAPDQQGPPLENSGLQIDAVDEGVDEPYGIIGADIIVDRLGQKQELRAFESGYVRHARLARVAWALLAKGGIYRAPITTA